MSPVLREPSDSKSTIQNFLKILIKSLPAERQQIKSQNYSVKRGLVVQTGRILALHARGPGFKSQRVHHFI